MNETLTIVEGRTPRGNVARFATRQTTNDAALVAGIMGEDEYRFARMPKLTGWAVDIGAHIGIITVLLALDNPGLRVLAIEALPDNVEILRQNVALNGLGERVEVIDAAATDDETDSVPLTFDYEWVGLPGRVQPEVTTSYVRDSRYIGNIFDYPEDEQAARTIQRPGIGLSALLAERGIDHLTLAKIDCEGCEWSVFRSPAVGKVDRWIGEYHGLPGFAGVHAALDRTHKVTERAGAHSGLFEAVLR